MTAKAQPAKDPNPSTYGLAQAKARLSEVVERARTEGPQQINYHGRAAAFVVSAEEWTRRTKPQGSLLDFFRSSPLYGCGIELERPPSDMPRELEL